jgi:hypothetical protein
LQGRKRVQALMEALSVTEIPEIVPAEEVNDRCQRPPPKC